MAMETTWTKACDHFISHFIKASHDRVTDYMLQVSGGIRRAPRIPIHLPMISLIISCQMCQQLPVNGHYTALMIDVWWVSIPHHNSLVQSTVPTLKTTQLRALQAEGAGLFSIKITSTTHPPSSKHIKKKCKFVIHFDQVNHTKTEIFLLISKR